MKKQDKKPRDVSYSQGYKLIEKHGYETVKNLGIENGMYESGRILLVSPYVVRSLVHKYGWKRPCEMVPHLVRAVKLGRAETSTYKHLDGSEIELPNTNNNKNNEE